MGGEYSYHCFLFCCCCCCFFLEGLTSFSEITEDSDVASKMKEVYQDINNIDLWVGGLAEDHEEGSELGPTFRA